LIAFWGILSQTGKIFNNAPQKTAFVKANRYEKQTI